jgi:hypothetical protein
VAGQDVVVTIGGSHRIEVGLVVNALLLDNGEDICHLNGKDAVPSPWVCFTVQ